MNKDLIISAVAGAAIVLVVGIVLSVTGVTPSIAGDFAGGVQPSVLFTANSGASSISPISGLPNFLVPGAISAGGVTANSQLTGIYTGVAFWPAAPVTIATSSFSVAATSTQVSFTASGFIVNDPCVVQISGTTSTLFTSAVVTAVNGNAVTSTVTFINDTAAAITVASSSPLTGTTSTVKTTCFATGV